MCVSSYYPGILKTIFTQEVVFAWKYFIIEYKFFERKRVFANYLGYLGITPKQYTIFCISIWILFL